jgi:hypothetical protein
LKQSFSAEFNGTGNPGNKTSGPPVGAIHGGIGGIGENFAVNQYKQNPVAIVM